MNCFNFYAVVIVNSLFMLREVFSTAFCIFSFQNLLSCFSKDVCHLLLQIFGPPTQHIYDNI